MALTNVPQFFGTVDDIMEIIAPNAGGSVPDSTSEEYAQWLLAIQMKYEEASRRGFWRRLLTRDTITLREDDTEAILPDRFQRANSLYIFAVKDSEGNDVDWMDPDRTPDGQQLYVEQINDPDDEDFGKWKVSFREPITSLQAEEDAVIWYWATPPKPNAGGDKVLLPGDMLAFGAMIEIFRSKNLPGSQDDARVEYENRLSTYLGVEVIPPKNELLYFKSNPRGIDYMTRARAQYTSRGDRSGRL